MSKTTNKFSPEVRERAVWLVLDNEGQHGSRWQAVMAISAKIGCAPQTLDDWGKKAEVDSSKRPGVSSEMAERMRALERENRELRQANEILRKASAYFAMAEFDRRSKRWSSSSMTIAVRMGSNRSARCCRSPLRPTMNIWPSVPIRLGCRIAPRGMRGFGPRSSAFSMRTGRSTACARSGGNCDGRALTWPAAQWPGI